MADGASVRVAVRVRPFNKREIDMKAKLCIQMQGESTTIIQPDTNQPKVFAFDFSYWSHDGFKDDGTGYSVPDGPDSRYASQAAVYKDLGESVLNNAFEGFNCSLFAYGQTGSGKSYSMVGYGKNKGIIPICCDKMFQRVTDAKDKGDHAQYQIQVTMLEIYNEQVRDLFNAKNNPPGGLKLREKKGMGCYVEGISQVAVNSYAEIEAKMEEGTKNRTIGQTKMNATSSRAHTVFGIIFTKKVKMPDGQESETTSKINLVDLAGSERADSTGATGDRLKEGCAINQSLSSLGNVISTLAENAGLPPGKPPKFVPYRNSVLTRLLQDALGGNSKTIMIAALSPADVNYDETLSTLRYADRAKKIKNAVVKNENPTDRLIRLLKEENEKLKKLLEGKGLDPNAAMEMKGGSAADIEAWKKKLEEEKKENDRIIAEMKKSWEEKIKEAAAARGQEDTSSAVLAKNAAASHLPHLILLNEDPQLSGNVVFMLKVGVTKIGNKNSDTKQDIELSGLGIGKQHALIENKDGVVALDPLNKSKCFVNGDLARQKVQLRHGDRVILGNSNIVFKFANPTAPEYKDEEENTTDDAWEKAREEFTTKQGLNKQNLTSETAKLEEEAKKTRAEFEEKLKAMTEQLNRERESARRQVETMKASITQKGANMSEEDRKTIARLEKDYADKTQKASDQLKDRKEMEQQLLQEQLKRRRENQKVEAQLASLIPLVSEVNQIADELDKKVRFEARLVIKPVSTLSLPLLEEVQQVKKIDVVVRVTSAANGNVWTWNLEKFDSRLFIMREMYQSFVDFGPREVPQSKDPFWDPVEACEIGKCYVYLKALSQLVEVENWFPILDHSGDERGQLRVEIAPEGPNGEELDYLSHSDELLGKTVVFNIRVPAAKGLPAKYSHETHVGFSFNDQHFETETCEMKTTDPRWKTGAKVRIEKIEKKHIRYLLQDACTFEVRGFPSPSPGAGATAAAKAPVCAFCGERPAVQQCIDCPPEAKRDLCAECFPTLHKAPSKKTHKTRPLGAPVAAPASAAAARQDVKDVKSGAAPASAPSTNAALNCDHCGERRPAVSCVECGSSFCESCDELKHRAASRKNHNRQPFESPMAGNKTATVPACQRCEEKAANVTCQDCVAPAPSVLCSECFSALHKKPAMKAHKTIPF